MTSGYLDRRSVTGGRCSLLVEAPSALTINMTLHSLVGAGVSSERDREQPGSASCPVRSSDCPVRSASCPVELVIEDGRRRHVSPLCPLRQQRQRNVYQSHDSQIQLYFTRRRRRDTAVDHRVITQQPTRPPTLLLHQHHHRHHRHRIGAFILRIEGKSYTHTHARTHSHSFIHIR